ncbi:MAG: hypothetical protein OEN49_09750 [Gammaproteobacteria bacterium]|nr:hypothetical protein [Gammaproteobacteria bacterium]
MDIRTRLAEITKNARSQTDLDAIVSRYGGLNNLFRNEFPSGDAGEFLYEWESIKLQIRREV